MSWDLSPSSATNTTPKLTANAIRTPSMWECSSRRGMRPGPDAQPPHACGDARSHPSGGGRTGGLRSGTRGRTRSKVSLARPESGRAAGLAPVCRPQRWELLPLVRARIAGRPPTGRAGRGRSYIERQGLTSNSQRRHRFLPGGGRNLEPSASLGANRWHRAVAPGRTPPGRIPLGRLGRPSAVRECDERRAARRQPARRAGPGRRRRPPAPATPRTRLTRTPATAATARRPAGAARRRPSATPIPTPPPPSPPSARSAAAA